MNMNIDMKVLYTYAKKFMQMKFPDEAPYFDIAWEVFEEFAKRGKDKDLDLKGPIVRLEGDDTIMAPIVIRAFYTLFSTFGKKIESLSDEDFKSSAMETLSENKVSSELSMKIVDFFLETHHD